VTDRGSADDAAEAARLEAALTGREADDPLIRPRLAGQAILDQMLLVAKKQGGAHLPSIAAALGSLGGHACQVAAYAGIAMDVPAYADRTVVTIDVRSGEQFVAGDAIDWPLAESPTSLWALAGGAARRLGGSLPDLEELFRHGTQSLGGPDFGIPRVAEGVTTGSTPREWLRTWRPMAILLGRVTSDPQHGPIAFGVALQQLFDLAGEKAPGRYDFGAMMRLVMDCAIATSKIRASDEELGATS
jgi:hypothetical protein